MSADPPIRVRRAGTVPSAGFGPLLGRGNNGAAIRAGGTGRDYVYKWTVDPVEVQAWLAAQGHANEYGPLAGLPRVIDIRMGQREAVITREYVARPGGLWTGHAPLIEGLRQASQIETAGRMQGSWALINHGRGLRSAVLRGHPASRPVDDALRVLHAAGAGPVDVRPANLGWVRGRAGNPDRMVLHDPGRAPTEALSNSRGEAWARCPNELSLSIAVHRLLRKAPSYRACRIVDAGSLAKVMRAHGWREEEIRGTAGFHTEPIKAVRGGIRGLARSSATAAHERRPTGDILLERSNGWALLHEMIHAAGVVDRDLSVWLTEGITEAAAQAVARQNAWKHTPTYPAEVQFVQRRMVRALGWSELEIASAVAARPEQAATTLAHRLVATRGAGRGHGRAGVEAAVRMWTDRFRRADRKLLTGYLERLR